MKKLTTILFLSLVILMGVRMAPAADLDALDRVSVLMPKAQAAAILGVPHETALVAPGLTAELYRLTEYEVLVGAGCIYDDAQHVAGQAFFFQGLLKKEIGDLMKERGFSLLEDKGDILRLSGNDDDTGQPIIAVIMEDSGYTTIMTFEKDFYERRKGQ